jgi:hypothetical protein
LHIGNRYRIASARRGSRRLDIASFLFTLASQVHHQYDEADEHRHASNNDGDKVLAEEALFHWSFDGRCRINQLRIWPHIWIEDMRSDGMELSDGRHGCTYKHGI